MKHYKELDEGYDRSLIYYPEQWVDVINEANCDRDYPDDEEETEEMKKRDKE